MRGSRGHHLSPAVLLQWGGPDEWGTTASQTLTANSRTDGPHQPGMFVRPFRIPCHPASTHLSLLSPYIWLQQHWVEVQGVHKATEWKQTRCLWQWRCSYECPPFTDKPITKHDQDGEWGCCQDPGERMQHLCNWLRKIRDKAIQNINLEQAPWDRDEICFTAKNCTKDSKEWWRQWDEQVYWKQKKGKHAALWNCLRCFLYLLPKGHVTWLSIDVDGKNYDFDTLDCRIL